MCSLNPEFGTMGTSRTSLDFALIGTAISPDVLSRFRFKWTEALMGEVN